MTKKILYIAPHRPGRSPGQRFRFEQYIPYFQENNFEITYSYIVNKWDDKILYSKGNYMLKLWIAFKAIFIRTADWFRCKNFDLIVIYREANFLGNVFFEKRFSASKVPVVFDFDDAIWLNDVSEGNSNLKWLKRPEKTAEIVALSTLVIAGNNYLANYAKQYNSNVIVVPTSVDTDYHKSFSSKKESTICIGWTGSSTTIKHFEEAMPIFKKIKKEFGDKIKFKVISDVSYSEPEIDLECVLWSAPTEIEELDKIDIGIMPLPDDKWSEGKCGFKGIQYMALGKAAVLSPVGVNKELIVDGQNGFLAFDEKDWLEKLRRLINDSELRRIIGINGRNTILGKYSVKVQQNMLNNVFNELTK